MLSTLAAPSLSTVTYFGHLLLFLVVILKLRVASCVSRQWICTGGTSLSFSGCSARCCLGYAKMTELWSFRLFTSSDRPGLALVVGSDSLGLRITA